MIHASSISAFTGKLAWNKARKSADADNTAGVTDQTMAEDGCNEEIKGNRRNLSEYRDIYHLKIT